MEPFFNALFGKSKITKPVQNLGLGRMDDRVDDGFLIVGETSMERSTVLSGQGADACQLPPSYPAQGCSRYTNPYANPSVAPHANQQLHTDPYVYHMNNQIQSPTLPARTTAQNQTLPSYRQAQSMPSWSSDLERQASLEKDCIEQQEQQSGSLAQFQQSGSMHAFSGIYTVLADVPFKLSPMIEMLLLDKSVAKKSRMFKEIDLKQYAYDFAFEESVLRECGLTESDLNNLRIENSGNNVSRNSRALNSDGFKSDMMNVERTSTVPVRQDTGSDDEMLSC